MDRERLALASVVCLAVAPGRAASAPPQTDWWRAENAAVVEYTDGRLGIVCSLFLYDRTIASVVTWSRSESTEISFYNDDWHFAPDQTLEVGVQIGAVWLGGATTSDLPRLTATAEANHVSVAVQQPIVPLLRNASRITVRLADRETSVAVDSGRMPKLLNAAQRCRSAIRAGSER